MAMLIAIVTTIYMQNAHAASGDAHDKAVVAHLVHLSGYGGDNEANRKALSDKYKACADRNTLAKKKITPLPAAGIPEKALTIEDDIYYSANRTLTVKQGILYDIDFETCALVERPHHVNELRSSSGICSMDMIKKEARGQCDNNAVDTAAGSASTGSIAHKANRKAPVFDPEKVPPEFRASLREQMERLKTLPQSPGGAHMPATGASKLIAHYQCEVYRDNKLDIEVCVAHPKSTFVIPAAGLNATVPGILLEAKSKALAMQANKVNMDTAVSPDMFLVPADIKILSR